MDKLTLEHLAPYFPYGLKCHNMGNTDEEGHAFVSEIVGLDQDTVWVSHEHEDDDYAYSDTFPLLRPLSDLTKEIEHNCERFVPKEVLIDRYDLKFDENDDFFLDYYCIGETDSPWTGYHIIQLLIQWHFDVFGLIDKGLAIDINSIEGKETKGNG